MECRRQSRSAQPRRGIHETRARSARRVGARRSRWAFSWVCLVRELLSYQDKILSSARIARCVSGADAQTVGLADPIGLSLAEDAEGNTPAVEGAGGYRDALFSLDDKPDRGGYIVGAYCPTEKRHLAFSCGGEGRAKERDGRHCIAHVWRKGRRQMSRDWPTQSFIGIHPAEETVAIQSLANRYSMIAMIWRDPHDSSEQAQRGAINVQRFCLNRVGGAPELNDSPCIVLFDARGCYFQRLATQRERRAVVLLEHLCVLETHRPQARAAEIHRRELARGRGR